MLVGDRVQLIKPLLLGEFAKTFKGIKGTVIGVKIDSFLIEFDVNIDGHNGNSFFLSLSPFHIEHLELRPKTKQRHCWVFRMEEKNCFTFFREEPSTEVEKTILRLRNKGICLEYLEEFCFKNKII